MVDCNRVNSGQKLQINGQDFEYLNKVMRSKIGDPIEIFNGKSGDFLATITEVSKRSLTVEVGKKIKDQESSSNISIAFAPVKNVKPQFIAQKAVELNVGKLIPVITKHSVVDSVNPEKLAISIKEACEQCETNFIPSLSEIIKLGDFLAKDETKEKILILCDESGRGQKASNILPEIAKNREKNQEVVVFIGPEGGFSEDEFKRFYECENLTPISLGKNILRADTAIISALTLVNEYI